MTPARDFPQLTPTAPDTAEDCKRQKIVPSLAHCGRQSRPGMGLVPPPGVCLTRSEHSGHGQLLTHGILQRLLFRVLLCPGWLRHSGEAPSNWAAQRLVAPNLQEPGSQRHHTSHGVSSPDQTHKNEPCFQRSCTTSFLFSLRPGLLRAVGPGLRSLESKSGPRNLRAGRTLAVYRAVIRFL
ncbi:unnamed protein product [Pleuronectes platessa]|uniref:Uncharacterized protein n=1 Tax=Pleuronectes platessa TaxID=8262 RepID=A0A9N7YQK6_PLEPL|nr:unnamed protein product [Pleuronectes platessa]